jgi:deoxyribonuclease-4
VAEALNRLHAALPALSLMVLLETTAGQGTSLGRRFEELAAILERVESPQRVGLCLDTCHLFAAGYELRTPAGYEAAMRELDLTLGIDRVRAIHLNDSKSGLGSRVDRHTHIGEGALGTAAFRLLLNDARFRGVPMILETPKDDDDGSADRRNLACLRRLIHGDGPPLAAAGPRTTRGKR